MSRIRRRSGSSAPPPPGTGGGGTQYGSNTKGPEPVLSKKLEYEDDGSMRMPVLNSPAALAAARRMVRQLSARSGRSSTALVSEAGVRPYTASLLGNAN